MLPDLLQPALVGLGPDRFQFLGCGDSLAMFHVGQFDPLQPVLVQLVEIHGQVQEPHEDAPLPSNRPRRGLRGESARDVGQAIFGFQGIKRTIAEPWQEVHLDHRFGSSQVKPLFDLHGLPIEREKFSQRRRNRPSRYWICVALLNLGHHGDGGLFGLFFGEIVTEKRTIPHAFPAEIQIEGQALLRRSLADRVSHQVLSDSGNCDGRRLRPECLDRRSQALRGVHWAARVDVEQS
ncbi:MAG: hypothetical protein A4E20_13280 [Nitrospira sp. SG-bin2]|nr:MAG: hypothetical protein A4E20_13280 [Nitrospira sp. SG-bin2]